MPSERNRDTTTARAHHLLNTAIASKYTAFPPDVVRSTARQPTTGALFSTAAAQREPACSGVHAYSSTSAVYQLNAATTAFKEGASTEMHNLEPILFSFHEKIGLPRPMDATSCDSIEPSLLPPPLSPHLRALQMVFSHLSAREFFLSITVATKNNDEITVLVCVWNTERKQQCP